jgi:hypothetical protein
MTQLTIAIPTYNREIQIINLLKHFIENKSKYTKFIIFDIVILDNSTNPQSSNLIKNSIPNDIDWIEYYKNEKNIGFDLNILNCYLKSKGDYIWIFGDDDFPEINCFEYIKAGLFEKPDVLLLPFRQPLSLKKPQYDVCFINNQLDCITTITLNTKITSFVLKNISIDQNYLSKFNHTGWMHLILAFEILHKSKNNLSTINMFCARALSDKDVKSLDWVPSAFINFDKLLLHPYVSSIKNNSKIKKIWNDNYLSGITLTCWGASGSWLTRGVTKQDYILFGKNYPFKIILISKPRYFFYWLLIKFNLSSLFLKHFNKLSLKSGYEK